MRGSSKAHHSTRSLTRVLHGGFHHVHALYHWWRVSRHHRLRAGEPREVQSRPRFTDGFA
jgi:hypothetical protein